MPAERVGFYPFRDGTNLTPVIETFSKPPQFVLTDNQRQNVLAYERTLTKSSDLNADLGKLTTDGKVLGIESIYDMRINTSVFYLDYFTQGFRRLGENIDGIAENVILGADYSKVTSEEASKLERESAEMVQKRTVDAFASKDYASVEGIPNPTRLVVVRNPSRLVEKVEGLRKLKKYLKKADEALDEDPESKAKKLMLTIHRRRVNEMIAALYPDARAFAAQVHHSRRDEDVRLLSRLTASMKRLRARGEESQRIAARIDKFSNGAGEMVNNEYIQVSLEAKELADRIASEERGFTFDEYRYNDVDRDSLSGRMVTAETLKQLFDKYLDKLGILSESNEYDPDRAGPAEDEKWQAVIHPKNITFEVEQRQKAVKIPPKFNRSVANITPAGGVPVFDHESIHIIQGENRAGLGLAITEKAKMDRGGTLAEGGGVRAEIATQKDLFGQIRSTNPEYLRAAQTILSGGTYVEAFKAFFDSSMSRNPDQDKRAVAELAADRVLRLFRNGGDPRSDKPYLSNSGPFEYLEQDLIAKQIDGTPLEKAFYYTGVNLQMLAELHKYGMVDLEKTWIPPLPSEVLREDIDALVRGQ